jgi:hypothetical protein
MAGPGVHRDGAKLTNYACYGMPIMRWRPAPWSTSMRLPGNTGASTAPHSHFHVMDGPPPLNANGLPYVATECDDALEHGTPVKTDPRLAGNHVRELPLNEEIANFN